MSNENQMSASAAAAPTTKSGRSVPAGAEAADWKQHRAKRRAAKRADKKWYSQPLAVVLSVGAVGVSILLASWFAGMIENGNQLPQALRLAQLNAQSDVLRSQVLLDEDENTATLVWSAGIESAVIIVEGLPKLESGDYRVWYSNGDETTLAGVLNVDHDGSETWAVLDGDVSEAGSVIVTVEFDSTSAPSGNPLLEITL